MQTRSSPKLNQKLNFLWDMESAGILALQLRYGKNQISYGFKALSVPDFPAIQFFFVEIPLGIEIK